MKRLLSIIIFLIPALLNAQQTLTLSSAIDSALKNNLDIQIARNITEISKINNSFGNAGGLPTVSATATNNNSYYDLNQKLSNGTEIIKNNVSSHVINTGISAGMTLFNGMKILATKERFNILQNQSELQLNLQVQNILASVMVSYYDIIRQQSYLNIIRSTVNLSAEKLNIVKERQQVGMANDADLLQSQMDLNLAEQNLVSQNLLIEQQKLSLLELMGVANSYQFDISDSIKIDNSLRSDSILNFLGNNPQYLSAIRQVRINEQIVKEVRAQRYPSLRISSGYNFNYNSSSAGFNLFTQNYGPSVGASLQVPVFNGLIYKTQQDVAKINVLNAELEKENILRSLKADAERTFQSYQTAMLQISTQQKSFENAKSLMQLVIHRFQLGQATILEVKAAQSSYESAGYLLTNLQYAAKVSEIELKRLIFNLDY